MRTVSVPRERVPRWLTGFTERHGTTTYVTDDRVTATAADGAVAEIVINSGPAAPGDQPTSLLTQVSRDLVLGLLLVRKGGHAVGLVVGDQLRRHANGSSYVQSRTKAGGWSQQRYARRRDNQATRAYGKAADDAVKILTDDHLDRLVVGGDRAAIDIVLADQRLSSLRDRWDGRVFGVADPRLVVLRDFVPVALGVTINLNDQATT